jgi:hypothetical protein
MYAWMTGCFALAIPSAVSIAAPLHSQAKVRQERMGLPFMITVQDPHAPNPPHQSLGEVKPISSRKSCRKVQFGSTIYRYFPPLTVNSIAVSSAAGFAAEAVPLGAGAVAFDCAAASEETAMDPKAGAPTASPASFRKSLRDNPDPSFFPCPLGLFFSCDIFPLFLQPE